MATQPEIPAPDTIQPQSPPEAPPFSPPLERPVPDAPEIVPDRPDFDRPDVSPPETPPPAADEFRTAGHDARGEAMRTT